MVVQLLCNHSWILKNRFWTTLAFIIFFAVSSLNSLFFYPPSSSFLLFQTFRSICFSILRMTKVNVHVLKKSETNSWIFMKIWWHIVVRSSWLTTLFKCSFLTFFQFYWGIIHLHHCLSLRSTAKWFDLHVLWIDCHSSYS